MPARDGTGPFGTGPVGRGLGPCGGNEQEFGDNQQFGMANRWGQRRFGNRHPRWGRRENTAYHDADSEIQSLQNRQSWLQEQLTMISRRIEEISKT